MINVRAEKMMVEMEVPCFAIDIGDREAVVLAHLLHFVGGVSEERALMDKLRDRLMAAIRATDGIDFDYEYRLLEDIRTGGIYYNNRD